MSDQIHIASVVAYNKMKNKNKLLLGMIFLMVIIPMALAQQQFLGVFKQGSDVNLIQICDNSTYSNITRVIYPSSQFAIDSQIEMIKTGDNYVYIFNLTQKIGSYLVYGHCDESGVDHSWSYNFEVTNSGTILSLGQIFVYSLFLILCLVVVYFSARLIFNNPLANDSSINAKLYEIKKKNEFLYYVSVLKSKMWIVGLFGIYLSLLLFLVLANQLVYNLGFSDLNEILKNIVIVMSWGLIPFGVFWIGYTIIVFYKTTERIMRYQFGGARE